MTAGQIWFNGRDNRVLNAVGVDTNATDFPFDLIIQITKLAGIHVAAGGIEFRFDTKRAPPRCTAACGLQWIGCRRLGIIEAWISAPKCNSG